MRGIDCDDGSLTSADDCFIPTSYRKILARISETPLAKAHIHFNTVMTSVECRTGEITPVCVTTADGKEQFFEEVVVTSPLGWLKRNKSCLPGLRPRIASAIESISFGRLEKVGGPFQEQYRTGRQLSTKRGLSLYQKSGSGSSTIIRYLRMLPPDFKVGSSKSSL